MDTSCSIGRYCFSLGSGTILWSSRKQRTVANLFCYAKYIALHDAAHEANFLCQLLTGLHLHPSKATPIHCDNNATTILSEDYVWHPHVKHIRVKYYYVREQVEDREVIVARTRSANNVADILTKPLGQADFLQL